MREEGITGLSYKDSGVDIDAGNDLVEAIKPLAEATARSGVASGLGGFGAMFDLKAAGYQDPILVAATDGVGTKLKLAIQSNNHSTVGIDLVAMCVNDLVVQGAEPLFFLDYYATAGLEVETARDVVSGIAEGCKLAGCALIGGETAEMPGMYSKGDYDLAGFSVGAVERGNILTGEGVNEGDVILGLASSGLHSNGFSLVRRVVGDQGLEMNAPAPFDQTRSLAEALLEPTRIYVKSCLATLNGGGVKALAHITGGGLVENIPRVLPDGLGAEIDVSAWELPEVFSWLAKAGGIAKEEMARTFNCGIGMAVIADAAHAKDVQAALKGMGETVFTIGSVIAAPPAPEDRSPVLLKGLENSWPG